MEDDYLGKKSCFSVGKNLLRKLRIHIRWQGGATGAEMYGPLG